MNDKMSAEITPASEEDLYCIIDYLQKDYKLSLETRGHTFWHNLNHILECREKARLFAFKIDEQICGYSTAEEISEGIIKIQIFEIFEYYRNKGYGRIFSQKIEAILHSLYKVKSIILASLPDKEGFWLKMGYIKDPNPSEKSKYKYIFKKIFF